MIKEQTKNLPLNFFKFSIIKFMSCLTVKSLLVQPFYEKHTDKILSEKNFIYEEKLKSPLSHSPLPLKTENLQGRKNFENSSKKNLRDFL